MSRSSSSLNLATPARSSSLAIQYWISYSFPSSNGPSFKPTSWISGQLRLHITRTGVFSKVKSVSLMAVDCFAVNVVDCSFSPERHCPRELLFYRFKVTEETEVELRKTALRIMRSTKRAEGSNVCRGSIGI